MNQNIQQTNKIINTIKKIMKLTQALLTAAALAVSATATIDIDDTED